MAIAFFRPRECHIRHVRTIFTHFRTDSGSTADATRRHSRTRCVVMLRPTMSAGLYYQMVGRGFRLHLGKHNCLVVDFGGNVLRHGPVDANQYCSCSSLSRSGLTKFPTHEGNRVAS